MGRPRKPKVNPAVAEAATRLTPEQYDVVIRVSGWLYDRGRDAEADELWRMVSEHPSAAVARAVSLEAQRLAGRRGLDRSGQPSSRVSQPGGQEMRPGSVRRSGGADAFGEQKRVATDLGFANRGDRGGGMVRESDPILRALDAVGERLGLDDHWLRNAVADLITVRRNQLYPTGLDESGWFAGRTMEGRSAPVDMETLVRGALEMPLMAPAATPGGDERILGQEVSKKDAGAARVVEWQRARLQSLLDVGNLVEAELANPSPPSQHPVMGAADVRAGKTPWGISVGADFHPGQDLGQARARAAFADAALPISRKTGAIDPLGPAYTGLDALGLPTTYYGHSPIREIPMTTARGPGGLLVSTEAPPTSPAQPRSGAFEYRPGIAQRWQDPLYRLAAAVNGWDPEMRKHLAGDPQALSLRDDLVRGHLLREAARRADLDAQVRAKGGGALPGGYVLEDERPLSPEEPEATRVASARKAMAARLSGANPYPKTPTKYIKSGKRGAAGDYRPGSAASREPAPSVGLQGTTFPSRLERIEDPIRRAALLEVARQSAEVLGRGESVQVGAVLPESQSWPEGRPRLEGFPSTRAQNFGRAPGASYASPGLALAGGPSPSVPTVTSLGYPFPTTEEALLNQQANEQAMLLRWGGEPPLLDPGTSPALDPIDVAAGRVADIEDSYTPQEREFAVRHEVSPAQARVLLQVAQETGAPLETAGQGPASVPEVREPLVVPEPPPSPLPRPRTPLAEASGLPRPLRGYETALPYRSQEARPLSVFEDLTTLERPGGLGAWELDSPRWSGRGIERPFGYGPDSPHPIRTVANRLRDALRRAAQESTPVSDAELMARGRAELDQMLAVARAEEARTRPQRIAEMRARNWAQRQARVGVPSPGFRSGRGPAAGTMVLGEDGSLRPMTLEEAFVEEFRPEPRFQSQAEWIAGLPRENTPPYAEAIQEAAGAPSAPISAPPGRPSPTAQAAGISPYIRNWARAAGTTESAAASPIGQTGYIVGKEWPYNNFVRRPMHDPRVAGRVWDPGQTPYDTYPGTGPIGPETAEEYGRFTYPEAWARQDRLNQFVDSFIPKPGPARPGFLQGSARALGNPYLMTGEALLAAVEEGAPWPLAVPAGLGVMHYLGGLKAVPGATLPAYLRPLNAAKGLVGGASRLGGRALPFIAGAYAGQEAGSNVEDMIRNKWEGRPATAPRPEDESHWGARTLGAGAGLLADIGSGGSAGMITGQGDFLGHYLGAPFIEKRAAGAPMLEALSPFVAPQRIAPSLARPDLDNPIAYIRDQMHEMTPTDSWTPNGPQARAYYDRARATAEYLQGLGYSPDLVANLFQQATGYKDNTGRTAMGRVSSTGTGSQLQRALAQAAGNY